jgi:hypothetical protein
MAGASGQRTNASEPGGTIGDGAVAPRLLERWFHVKQASGVTPIGPATTGRAARRSRCRRPVGIDDASSSVLPFHVKQPAISPG